MQVGRVLIVRFVREFLTRYGTAKGCKPADGSPLVSELGTGVGS